MSSRNSDVRTSVVAQSACPVFAGSFTIGVAAAILPLPPFSRDLGPNGVPLVAEVGQLYILQSATAFNVRLVGSGTVNATGTITYTAPSGAQTIVINGYTLSFTSSGVQNTDAATAATLINADPILNKFFSAAAVTNVCTVTDRISGAGGNLISFTGTGTGAAFSGAGFLTSGVGPTAGATATNSYIVPANQPFFVYRLWHHTQLDVIAGGAGTLQVYLGV